MTRMPRPCTCDRLDQCRVCWLYHHDPRYRALWDGAVLAVRVLVARPRAEWPWLARLLARTRAAEDLGVGDTLARRLGALGVAWQRWYRRIMGADCACHDRRKALNALFPYEQS